MAPAATRRAIRVIGIGMEIYLFFSRLGNFGSWSGRRSRRSCPLGCGCGRGGFRLGHLNGSVLFRYIDTQTDETRCEPYVLAAAADCERELIFFYLDDRPLLFLIDNAVQPFCRRDRILDQG